MITTMAESGSTEEQTELFILNSQKLPKLPAEESAWFLQSVENNAATLLENCLSPKVEEQSSSVLKRRSSVYSNSNWPPADWRTAPGFNSSSVSGLKKSRKGIFAEKDLQQADISISGINSEFNIEGDTRTITQGAVLLEAEISEALLNNSDLLVASGMNIALDSVDHVALDSMNLIPSNSREIDTGRLGEFEAFKYFMAKEGNETSVNWVNETKETGLPYDIVLGDDEDSREYIEVKATKSARKKWFHISMRQWQFAIEKGESFSIAHVVLADNNMARVSMYKNPARLCQLGNLKLAFLVP